MSLQSVLAAIELSTVSHACIWRRGALVLSVIALLSFPASADNKLAGTRPNIVFILTDDQGYGDLSCHGNPILQTPNIDRLHAEGVRFTDFHVSPTCSPTRTALLTGRHEFKNGVTHTVLERERLSPNAVTLAQVLKSAGYTTGIFGKWHLGDEPDRWPNRRGFDEMFIHGAGGIGQSYPGSCGDAPGNTYFNPAILHNGTFEKTSGYCTDVFFGEAISWIEAVKGRKPFYCYIATNAPHAPLDVRPADEARYTGKVQNPNVAKFFGMISNIDDNVGRLLAKLREWNLERSTLVIFMNDNGGTVGVDMHNAGMRGSKATPWLGGTRASSLWRWPGTLEPRRLRPLDGTHRFLSYTCGAGRCGSLGQDRGADRRPQPCAVARESHRGRGLIESFLRTWAAGPRARQSTTTNMQSAACGPANGTWSVTATARSTGNSSMYKTIPAKQRT